MTAATYNKGYLAVVVRCTDLLFAGWIWRDYGITISSFTGLEMRKPSPRVWARVLNWFLNRFEAGHCNLAVAADLDRAQQAIRILTGVEQP